MGMSPGWATSVAALPQHNAVSLRLTGKVIDNLRLRLRMLEALAQAFNLEQSTERQSLSALGGGKATNSIEVPHRPPSEDEAADPDKVECPCRARSARRRSRLRPRWSLPQQRQLRRRQLRR